ncbi:uncharacterized protein LOC143376219 isoform X1 [Andrena cerasifolii]|uniref:uncharacterized protein LOC143376219 isoform X1 n=1 Tax=Andrena cerasifolii TaxID=2819439 RepID=UPI0040376EE9
MEGYSYISCIKINGVHILPPLMTKDLKEEMSNYKQLAMNVERKLEALRVAKPYGNEVETEPVRKESKFPQLKRRICSAKKHSAGFESKSSNCKEIVTATNGISTDTSDSSTENTERLSQWDQNRKPDIECKPERQINLAPGIISRPESIAGINEDHRSNETTSTRSDATEVTSEVWKPRVPKTLDIIPLSLNNPNDERNGSYQECGLDNVGNTPKLVRQGSYVLDTPSPILLAHMQMELASSTCSPCSEYVPSSNINTVRRKEWNIAQAKIEWENKSKSKELLPGESLGGFPKRKGPCCSNSNRNIRKSISLQAKPKSMFIPYSSARSVDCIQTMLANERLNNNSVEMTDNGRFVTDNSKEKKRRFQNWKPCHSFPKSATSRSTYKRGCSLENLTSVDAPSAKYVENGYDKIPASSNYAKEISTSPKSQDSTSKLKSSIASNKLLTIYKKVQEMHMKQMAELMSRQQREQTLLQEEFEEQQLLLLTEIRKSFPEILAPLLSENVLSTTFGQVIPDNEKLIESIRHSTENTESLRSNLHEKSKVEHLQDNNTDVSSCPLDYICSETESTYKSDSPVITVEENVAETQLNNTSSHERELVEEGGRCKRLNVSRQLFPLDSKTTHLPILDRTMYGAKHIEAVNLINAYARGYLVRRMIRTERVIALKNTYKEALHCMLKLHVDAPLNRSEFNFLHRLQLQCDAASMNIVELFAQSPKKRMQVIEQDREIKQSRIERPTSARSYSFATQRTLARKKLKEMEDYQPSSFARSCLSRSRCQTWTSDIKEKLISPNILYHSIKRSTSAGTVRKPWR